MMTIILMTMSHVRLLHGGLRYNNNTTHSSDKVRVDENIAKSSMSVLLKDFDLGFVFNFLSNIFPSPYSFLLSANFNNLSEKQFHIVLPRERWPLSKSRPRKT